MTKTKLDERECFVAVEMYKLAGCVQGMIQTNTEYTQEDLQECCMDLKRMLAEAAELGMLAGRRAQDDLFAVYCNSLENIMAAYRILENETIYAMQEIMDTVFELGLKYETAAN